MASTSLGIHPIDVGYLGLPEAALAFLIRAPQGALLVECGTAATRRALESGLEGVGVAMDGVGHLLLSHIHLDHAGAAGHLAAMGARVNVHPFGVRHLIDPGKLIASSRRVHGAAYDRFYGDPLPVPPDRVVAAQDGVATPLLGVQATPLFTPGHARHHVVWILEEGERRHAFMGDLAGIRVPQSDWIAVPTPPPEYEPDAWIASLDRVLATRPTDLWLTHGGHVAASAVDSERFLRRARDRVMQDGERLRQAAAMPDSAALLAYGDWLRHQARVGGVPARQIARFLDDGFLRMNLGGARRAFAEPA
jgi:glyoxylase-like metal-dependent hydrolase (beta-lactamase superfamily II)